MFFSNIFYTRDITYGRVFVNYRHEKDDPYRVRICVGGNIIY